MDIYSKSGGTPTRLNTDDFCRRAEFLSRSWERNILNSTAALYRAIEIGLESDVEDPGQAAGDALMGFAVDRGLDTPQFDLLGHAEHLAAIADFVTYLLRTGEPWQRPADKNEWVSSAYLNGSRLRRVVLVDRWSDERALAEEHDWRTIGECATYDLPMDLFVIILGQQRDGRRHGPISKGFLHSVNDDLRFRKRDGEDFGPTWVRTFREESNIGREEWLEAMTHDGVLTESLIVHPVELPPYASEIRAVLEAKTSRIQDTHELPEAQLSMCDNALRPCQFRNCCPYFTLPSEDKGFLKLPPSPIQPIHS